MVYGHVNGPSQAVECLTGDGVRVLNVAGNRGSESPGIGARVERFMAEVLRRLGHGPSPPRPPAG